MINLSPQQFVTWNEPLEMLYACHSKVRNFCIQLQMLPDYLKQHGCNHAVQNDVKQILNYFNQAAPLHHDDEERDFFPALIAKVPRVQAEIEFLEQQHLELHENWALLSAQLAALLNGERETIDADLIKRFVSGYDLHLSIEEPLFELGREHFTEMELHAMGKIMAERRKL